MNYILSLVVPCYNEAQTIEKCIKRIFSVTQEKNISIEVIIVDDASKDNSYQILEKIASQHKEIKIFKHEKNKGKGAALRTGFIHATGNFVGIQDADMEYDPKDYIAMMEPLIDGRADVVYGSRFLCSEACKKFNFWHVFINKTLTRLSNLFTKLAITDMETCYKLFCRDIIQKITSQLKEDRFGFEPEVTARIAHGQYRIYECAISYYPRTYKEGKKIGWKDGLRALYCIFYYGMHNARKKK